MYKQTSMFFSLWNLQFLPNYVRNFILLRNNNKLLFNSQLAKFQDISPHCTFCNFYPLATDFPLESHLHIFHDCTVTKGCLDPYFMDFIDDSDFSLKIAVFKGIHGLLPSANLYFNIEVSLALLYIYTCKNKKKLPCYPGLKRFMCTVKNDMLRSSTQYLQLSKKTRTHYNGRFKIYDYFIDFLPP